MKFSRAISRIKWLSGEKTNVSKDSNFGFFTAQPFDPADSPRELHLIQMEFFNVGILPQHYTA
jgi:hypothetical protein